MIKLIIFDWDDVITLGSKEGYFKCYHQALAELGVALNPKIERKRILSKWGKPYREELRVLLLERPELLDQACELFKKYFLGDTFISELRLVDGVVKLLNRLSKKYKLAVATGQHHDMLTKKIFPKFNIPDVFERVITIHELNDPNLSKPHPHMVNELMKQVGVLPPETMVVGDAKNDVLMAQAAGTMPVVVLTSHLSRRKARELGVIDIIEDVSKLETVLSNR